MKYVRGIIDKVFIHLGGFIEKRSALCLGACLLLVGLMALQLPQVRLDTSTEGYLAREDPHLKDYLNFREQFGSDDFIVVGLAAPDIFTPDFLKRLMALHQKLAARTPHLAHITSLANIKTASTQDGKLIIRRFLPEDPRGWPSMAALRKRALSDAMIRNRLVTADGALATIILRIDNNTLAKNFSIDQALAGFADASQGRPAREFKPALTNQQNEMVVNTVQEIVTRSRAPNFTPYLSGTPILKKVLRKAMTRDAFTFIVLSSLVICFLLWIVFRRLSGVFLPMIVVSCSVIVTVGIMVLSGRSFKSPTIILPSFLMAMGVGASVHLLAIFYRGLRESIPSKAAVKAALTHSGMPIFLTCLTTATGLASFAGAEVAPVADLGLFGALGVMVAFIFTVVMLPAILNLMPRHKKKIKRADLYGFQLKLLEGCARFSTGRYKLIIGVSCLVLLFGGSGLFMVKFSHDPLAWLPRQLPLRQATQELDRRLGGLISVEVMLDSGQDGGLYQPSLLKRVKDLQKELEGFGTTEVKVVKTFSLVDLIQTLNSALFPSPAGPSLPADAKLAAQELLLFENAAPKDLEELVDARYRMMRLTLTAPWVDAVAYGPFLRALEVRLNEGLEGHARVAVTGLIPLMARTLSAAMHSAAQSYILAGLVITAVMVLVIGSLRLGLLSMFPNLLPILLALGTMGWLGVPLDIYTMLSGSIAIGLVVDDTIHFMYNFRRYFAQNQDVAGAVHATLITTGRALLITSFVLACGAFVCMLSSLENLFNFGLITGITILLALAADFLLFPALMVMAFNGRKPHLERVKT